jgi:hypothetical protein
MFLNSTFRWLRFDEPSYYKSVPGECVKIVGQRPVKACCLERFEEDVDIRSLRSYSELITAFRWWTGEKWKGSTKQWRALNREAERLGFEVPVFIRREIREAREPLITRKPAKWRREVVRVRGKPQNRYRDLKTGRFIKKPF